MSSPSMTPDIGVKIWDPLVRLTHWGIVGLVVVNALIVEEGSGWHVWAGYALAALLTLRLLWGLVGPAEARFSSFPPSPGRALDHLREIRTGAVTHHRSHNPLGALMVYALWLCLGVIVVTGIAMAGPPPADPTMSERSNEYERAGRQGLVGEHANEKEGEYSDDAYGAGDEGDEGDEGGEGHEEGALQEVHEIAVNLLYVLIAFHLLGVMFETCRSGRGIVLGMPPGHRNLRR